MGHHTHLLASVTQLNSRTELLSHIAVKRTKAEPAHIRRNQLDSGRYGSFVLSGDETALRYRYDEAEMMVQDQSLVPANLCHMGRDVPSAARDGPRHPPGRDDGAAAATGVARCQPAGALGDDAVES
jgi:hypothetical protein